MIGSGRESKREVVGQGRGKEKIEREAYRMLKGVM